MRWTNLALTFALLATLTACAGGGQYASRELPPDLMPYQGSVKIGAPYQVNGVWYYPKYDPNYDETGLASWYGPGFHGNRTANGERFNQEETTAAHKTLPLPSMVRVTNLENGEELVVRVNDRGPFVAGRIIDLSKKSAELLGIRGKNQPKVRVQYLKEETERYLASLGKGDASYAQAPSTEETAEYYADMRSEKTAQDSPTPQVSSKEINTSNFSQPATPPAPAQLAPLEDLSHDEQPASKTTAAEEYVAPPAAYKNAPSSAGGYYVQAGAFANEGNAEKVKKKLSGLGHSFITPLTVGGRTLHRVRLGPVESGAQARTLLSQVQAMGIGDAKVVKD
ncbi:MAG: septal ring lytic transglycosylase RlpA family protein [Alphaproteobacteria bacterium]|nr:septal ring lytic transglycosylase RlpA family protein [Alphaproteobacteria bacterium]